MWPVPQPVFKTGSGRLTRSLAFSHSVATPVRYRGASGGVAERSNAAVSKTVTGR